MRCDYAVNEGAGDRLELGGRVFYTCAAAEKTSSPFRLLVHGRSGHAALPGIADNALVKAAALIERAAAYREEPQLGPETEGFLAAVVGSVPPAAEALEAARAVDPAAAEILEPLLTTTLAPTVISASHKRNVIPGLCEVTIDCRLRPGDSQDDIDRVLREWFGPGDYELVWRLLREGRARRWTRRSGRPSRSSSSAPSPGRRAVPICVAGFTDSHWLRQAFGTVAYGFFPMRRWRRSSQIASCTPPTSGSKRRTSSSASSSCVMLRWPSADS